MSVKYFRPANLFSDSYLGNAIWGKRWGKVQVRVHGEVKRQKHMVAPWREEDFGLGQVRRNELENTCEWHTRLMRDTWLNL